jgi:hypothetical protein
MSRLVSKVLYVLVGLFVSLVVLSCSGMTWMIELLFGAWFGWVSYLSRVGPQIRPDWPAVGIGIGALALFAVGLHWFMAWFYAATIAAKASSSEAASFGQSTGAGWLVRWTLSVVAIVVMMFVAGISMVGITHQVVWLANSKEPLVNDSFARFREMRLKMQQRAEKGEMEVQHETKAP